MKSTKLLVLIALAIFIAVFGTTAFACEFDSECDDGNFCTTDACDIGTSLCTNSAIPECIAVPLYGKLLIETGSIFCMMAPYGEPGAACAGEELQAGTDGGLVLGTYQPMVLSPEWCANDIGPGPGTGYAFAGDGPVAIAFPFGYFGVPTYVSTNPISWQMCTPHNAPSVVAGVVDPVTGCREVTADLGAWEVFWNGSAFEQGPRIGSPETAVSVMASGMICSDNSYVLRWEAVIVGGPFHSMHGFWLLRGHLVGDDGDPCTENDICTADGCSGTPITVCSGGSACDPVLGCLPAPTMVGTVRGYTWFQDNTWFLDKNANVAWNAGIDVTHSFGVSVDVPVTGDWNGDGKTEVGVVRGNTWLLDTHGNGTWETGLNAWGTSLDAAYSFGAPDDIPVTGDWNGDGKTEIGVFRPSANAWFLDMNGNGAWNDGIDAVYSFGATGDKPVTGDWDYNGTTNIGVVRGNTWFLDLNANGAWDDGVDAAFSFGAPGDIPVTGDWMAWGGTTIGVFRPSTNTWFLDMDYNWAWDDGIDAAYSFGAIGDIPVTGKW